MEANTFIRISDLMLLEPVTFITDTFVALVCLHSALQIRKIYFTTSNVKSDWFYFFLFIGISTFLGGLAHLLLHYTGKVLHIITWQVSGVGIFFGEIATIKTLNNKKTALIIKRMSEIKLFIYLALIVYIKSFNVVIINCITGLIGLVFVVNMVNYLKTKAQESYLIALGLIICFISMLVFSSKITPHRWFNHNDLSHIVLSIGLYIMFLGARKVSYYRVTET